MKLEIITPFRERSNNFSVDENKKNTYDKTLALKNASFDILSHETSEIVNNAQKKLIKENKGM